MSLFAENDKREFNTIVGGRYDAMSVRMKAKGLPALPFGKGDLRKWTIDAMNPPSLEWHEIRYDNPVRCRYCGGMFGLKECAYDHRIPLSRGGGVDLDNLDLICAKCNAFKAEMLPLECDRLLLFLRNEVPLAYEDIYYRLSTWSKFVAGKRRAEMLARNEGSFPAKKGGKSKPPLVQAIDEHF